MRYDYTVKEISNGWLVLIDESDSEHGTESTYFSNKFEAFNHIAQRLVNLATGSIEEAKQENEKKKQEL